MLVLTRKLQERIHIGNDVTITIVRIQGNTVRVGIEAPQQVRVIRGELTVTEEPSREESADDADNSESPIGEGTQVEKAASPIARLRTRSGPLVEAPLRRARRNAALPAACPGV